MPASIIVTTTNTVLQPSMASYVLACFMVLKILTAVSLVFVYVWTCTK